MGDRDERAFKGRTLRLSKTFTHSDIITEAGGGSGAVAMPLGTPPYGAVLIDYYVRPAANFAGGSVSQLNATIGPSGDPDQIASAIALHTGTADGRLRNGTAGILPKGPGYGGSPLFLTVTPTGADVSELTAGSVDVDLIFSAGGDRRTRE